MSIGVSRIEISVLSSLGVISWGGKGDGGKGSSDDNEELHSVKKYKKFSIKKGMIKEDSTYLKIEMKRIFQKKKNSLCDGAAIQAKEISTTLRS